MAFFSFLQRPFARDFGLPRAQLFSNNTHVKPGVVRASYSTTETSCRLGMNSEPEVTPTHYLPHLSRTERSLKHDRLGKEEANVFRFFLRRFLKVQAFFARNICMDLHSDAHAAAADDELSHAAQRVRNTLSLQHE